MNKDILFIIFGLTICFSAVIGLFFIRKSNRQFLKDEAEKEKNKKMATH